jgi:polyhydroxyalkanoate synthase subunit PhaC
MPPKDGHVNEPGVQFADPTQLDVLEEGLRIMAFGGQVPTGMSPKDVVYTRNKTTLYRYRSTQRRHKTPILFVYALINRPYIFDLTPDSSFFKFLLEQGYDVFLVDWGTPGWEDRNMDFDDYVGEHLPRCVDRMLRASGAEEYTLFGYCMGGTMTAMYAALHPERMRNLVCLTAPFDFADTGLYGIWLEDRHFDPVRLAEGFGNIPAELIDTGNMMLRPVVNYVGANVTMWDRLLARKDMTSFLALNKWVKDGVAFPGAAFVQWITQFYQQNLLIKGEVTVKGEPVDLSRITVPLLNIAGEKDHIATPEQVAPLNEIVSSKDKTYLLLPAGHVAMLVGAGAKKGLWPKVLSWLDKRSD